MGEKTEKSWVMHSAKNVGTSAVLWWRVRLHSKQSDVSIISAPFFWRGTHVSLFLSLIKHRDLKTYGAVPYIPNLGAKWNMFLRSLRPQG
jgi:hypothetical protein